MVTDRGVYISEEIKKRDVEIERLRSRLEIDPSHPYDGIYARDETIRGLEKQIASLLNTLADERTESMRLRARVTELEGQHKGLVLNNAILRERPDLPLNRIPAARAMTKLYEDNERLRAALEQIASLDVPRPVGHTFRADGVASKHDKCWHGVTMSDECGVCLSNYARAALEGK